MKVREGYAKGNVKVETRASKKTAVREGPWRVREEKREANLYVYDVVSSRFLSLMWTLDRFLDISKVSIACSYVKDKVG